MKKYAIPLLILILSVSLLNYGCKALGINEGGGGEEEVNIPGTWVFTNVLTTNENEVHDRTFILTGDKNSGTVEDTVPFSNTTGTYTVTGDQFKMDLTNYDDRYDWTYEYEGTILNNQNMSGTSKTTTYMKDETDPVGVYDYNFTAKRKE